MGALEAGLGVAYGAPAPAVSDQRIIDCLGTQACQGGDPGDALDFIARSAGGLPSAADVPYTGVPGACSSPPPLAVRPSWFWDRSVVQNDHMSIASVLMSRLCDGPVCMARLCDGTVCISRLCDGTMCILRVCDGTVCIPRRCRGTVRSMSKKMK